MKEGHRKEEGRLKRLDRMEGNRDIGSKTTTYKLRHAASAPRLVELRQLLHRTLHMLIRELLEVGSTVFGRLKVLHKS